jgi:hypothetical protein
MFSFTVPTVFYNMALEKFKKNKGVEFEWTLQVTVCADEERFCVFTGAW